MDYLKEYNITEEEIVDIKRSILENEMDENLFIYDYDKIKKILDLFISIGVTNLYGILVTNPLIFGESYEHIKEKVDSYQDKEKLRDLINEDAMNLSIINLY